MVIFNRHKSCTVSEIDNNLLEARGSLIDTIHEMNVVLRVNKETLEILAAQANMVRIPHEGCSEAQAQDINLVGVKIGAGGRKAIQQAVGHAYGCTHLADITLDLFKCVIQAHYKLQRREMTQEQMVAKYIDQLGGSCTQWTKMAEQRKHDGL